MSERVDCVVIGAGVIGIAAARALAQAGREVIVLEGEAAIGQHTSSRNSEVIHAGIYYKPHSRKARWCVEGRERLYRYCTQRHVPHRRIGKLVVASSAADLGAIEGYARNAADNGVLDLRWLDAKELCALEPNLRTVGGFLSPSTGIIDSHALMLALQADAESAGALFALRSPLVGGEVRDSEFVLRTGGPDPFVLRAREVVNCAGLAAPQVAVLIRGIPETSIPNAHFLRGHYYTLSGRSPFWHLVYPRPASGGLGVHLTIDMAGQARFGPDSTEWSEGIDYHFNDDLRSSFVEAIAQYYPAIDPRRLVPGYVGVRPKIVGPNMPDGDFEVRGPAAHGIAGYVGLYGIESPGLTSCLCIADEVVAALEGKSSCL